MKKFVVQYALYLGRWQLSTPILAVFISAFSQYPPVVGSIVANFVGGLIFFWVDRFIFTSKTLSEQWEVREEITCFDCEKICRGYRLVFKKGYDRRKDPHPEYRCEKCSIEKSKKERSQ